MSDTTLLRPGKFYHVFNRGNNGENIFIEQTNYQYFITQYIKHVSPMVKTFAYCMLRNHFHILIRVRDSNIDNIEKRVSKSFSNMFNAYSRAFNNRYNRHGSLFERPFKRKPVETGDYLLQVVYYIHANPIKHDFVDRIEDWPFSSYHSYISNKKTKLDKKECLSWFNNLKEFKDYHDSMTLDKIEEKLISDILDDE